MCLQCMCESENLECPIPGMYLGKAKKASPPDGSGVQEGDYLLGWCNDPVVIIRPAENVFNCYFISGDLQVEDKWVTCTANQGYELIRACKKAGYRKRDGNVEYWLIKKLNLPEVKSYD